MLQRDCTAKMLDMEHAEIINVEMGVSEIIIDTQMKRRMHTCPVCETQTDEIHDYRIQIVKDLPVQGKKLRWRYRKRRYRCIGCGKRFYENNYLLPKWHRITNRMTAFCLLEFGKKCSQADIAKGLGVSPSTVGRWLKLLGFAKPNSLPGVLSIDEFRGNTDRGKFQCILTAPTEKAVFDILPTRYSSDISSYFRSFSNRQDVRYVVMDMNKEYLAIAKHHFPQAKIVIDKFHVVRYSTWAFENVRKRVQSRLLPGDRKYFKRSRKLLLAHMQNLSADSKAAVERMLLVSDDLGDAYLLKEKFYEFMASKDSVQGKERLRAFRMFALAVNLPEFEPCLTMLQNWEPYILNAFDCSLSNAFTEGANNTIKVLKRVAYGYHNFDNFRRRILTVLNTKMEPITFS